MQFLYLNWLKSQLSSLGQLEKDCLSMIQHWEVAAKKKVSNPELLALQKLCEDQKVFRHLGFGPFIKQENSIRKWLCKAREKEVLKKEVQELIKRLEKEGKEKSVAMLRLIENRADVVHGLVLKVIQLLERMSEEKKKSTNFVDGKFHYINREIAKIINEDSGVKNLFDKLETSKNLEVDIASLMMKMFDDNVCKMFQVNTCEMCSYKFAPEKKTYFLKFVLFVILLAFFIFCSFQKFLLIYFEKKCRIN
jgi:hypothetical protein